MADESGNEAQEAEDQSAQTDQPADQDGPDIPEEFKGEDGNADVAKLIARVSELSADKGQAAPDKYEFKLAEEVKIGEEKIELNADDPLMAEFQELAKAAGLSQEQFEKGATLHAKAIAAFVENQNKELETAGQAEIAKLGDNAGERLKAVDDWLIGKFGDEAKSFIGDLNSAASYVLLEKMIKQFTPAGNSNGASQGLSGRGSGPEKSQAARMYPNHSA